MFWPADPQEERKRDMRAYDAMPAELRTFLANTPVNFNAQVIAKVYRDAGLQNAMTAVRNSLRQLGIRNDR